MNTRQATPRTKRIMAWRVAKLICDGQPQRLTAGERKKALEIFEVFNTGPLTSISWRRQDWIIPSRIVLGAICLDIYWIVEVERDERNGKGARYQFTEWATGITGGWQNNPSKALKLSYFEATGREMNGSQNGRAEVGIFSEAIRALLVAICGHALPQNLLHLAHHGNQELKVFPRTRKTWAEVHHCVPLTFVPIETPVSPDGSEAEYAEVLCDDGSP